jgi:protein-disulfide isomerase
MNQMSKHLHIPVDESDHSRGNAAAPVTLVEYGDYECPDCLNSEPIVQQLLERFSNRLKIVFRHFPLSSVHPRASAAAQAAEAAGAQGKFWEMHRALFKNQHRLAELDLTHLALSLGLDVYAFERDIESIAFPKKVRAHYDGGVASGVNRTPTFFINGCRYDDERDVEKIAAAIEKASAAG